MNHKINIYFLKVITAVLTSTGVLKVKVTVKGIL